MPDSLRHQRSHRVFMADHRHPVGRLLRALLGGAGLCLMLFLHGCLDGGGSGDPDTAVDLELSDTPVELQIVVLGEWAAQIDPTSVDLEGRDDVPVGGAATIATYWERDRANAPGRTYIVATGDSFGASPPLASFFEEEPGVVALNEMGLDADTLGNHNFDRGLDHLQRMIDLAEYQTLASNLTNVPQNLRGVAPFTIVDLGGVPVAFVGIADPLAPDFVFPGSFGTMTVTDPTAALIEARELAAAQGATVFVAVTHLGTDEEGVFEGPIIDTFADVQDATDNGFAALVGQAARQPVVCTRVAGQPVDCAELPSNLAEQEVAVPPDRALAVQTRTKGRDYARIWLEVVPRTGELLERRVEFVVPEVAAVEPSTAVEQALAGFRAKLAEAKDQKVAVATARFDSDEQSIRSTQMPIGSVIADAMRVEADTDVAFVNAGGIRSDLPATSFVTTTPGLRRPQTDPPPWDVVRGDIDAVLPFVNSVVTQPITVDQLWDTVEHSVSEIPDGRFLQISGFRFWYDSAAPAGERVCAVALEPVEAGDPLRFIERGDTLRMRVATIDFLGQGGDGYSALTAEQGITRDLLANTVVAFLERLGEVAPADFAEPARIVDVAGDRSLCPE